MFLVTVAVPWVVTLGGLVLTVAQVASAGVDSAPGLLTAAGVVALAGSAWYWSVRWSEQRQLRGRLHDLMMFRILSPLDRSSVAGQAP